MAMVLEWGAMDWAGVVIDLATGVATGEARGAMEREAIAMGRVAGAQGTGAVEGWAQVEKG